MEKKEGEEKREGYGDIVSVELTMVYPGRWVINIGEYMCFNRFQVLVISLYVHWLLRVNRLENFIEFRAFRFLQISLIKSGIFRRRGERKNLARFVFEIRTKRYFVLHDSILSKINEILILSFLDSLYSYLINLKSRTKTKSNLYSLIQSSINIWIRVTI